MARQIFSLIRVNLLSKYARGHVLEAGCGSGVMGPLLLGKSSMHYVGVDISSRAIGVAKRQLRAYGSMSDLVRADIAFLPFREKVFGMVFNAGVMEHFERPMATLVELGRVVASGGHLVVVVPTPQNVLVRLRNLLKKLTGYYIDYRSFWGGADVFGAIHQAAQIPGFERVASKRMLSELAIETAYVHEKR